LPVVTINPRPTTEGTTHEKCSSANMLTDSFASESAAGDKAAEGVSVSTGTSAAPGTAGQSTGAAAEGLALCAQLYKM
jgi:hypothetical protein